MACAYAAPLDTQNSDDFEEDHELIGGFFQGDMEVEMTRNGEIAESKRWPNGVVPYKIDEIFGKESIFALQNNVISIGIYFR